MNKEELEKLKDFKVYAFEGDVYVKAEDYKKIAIENKKLNEFKEKRRESRFYFKAQMERAEPKTAREAEDLQRTKELFEKLYREELSCLEEENKTLKDNVEFLHSCLDDRDKSIAIMQEENKKLREYADNLDSENDNQAIEIEELKKENKKLKKYYDRDKEELMESCYSLARENDKLKSDLAECECSFGFENDEVGYRKREYKKLKKWIKDHCNGYGNLFPEDEMKRQWKKADKKRKLKSTYVYDAKQVRDVC